MRRSMFTLVSFLILFYSAEVSGMIRTLQLAELVKRAEFVFIVEVVERTQLPSEGPKPFPMLKNIVKLVCPLKGEWASETPVVFFTAGNLDGSFWVEDMPVFPEKGKKALIFFRNGKNGEPIFINAVQGLWPMDSATGALQGMGLGKNLKMVEDAIEAQRKP